MGRYCKNMQLSNARENRGALIPTGRRATLRRMDDWQTALDTYRQTSRPEDLFGVVKHLEPTINQAVISINGSPDPLLMSKARIRNFFE